MNQYVKLVNMNDDSVLRKKGNQEYYSMTLPQVGSTIRYHNFNKDELFQNDFFEYQVVDVIQELQEYWNGLYEERFTVLLKPV